MKIVYIGTPYFSASLLEKLHCSAEELGLEIDHVITQPDQPVGRKKILTPSPVKIMAQKLDYDVEHTFERFLKTDGLDLAILYAYGNIITKTQLEKPVYGFWNIHPSMLPDFRGASPITYPVILGHSTTGVTLMQMDVELDHGPVISQAPFTIPETALRPELEVALTEMAFQILKDTLPAFKAEKHIKCYSQDHHKATFTRQLEKNDGYISWDLLQKSMKNERITFEALPSVIQDYYQRNNIERLESETFESAKIVWNLYRSFVGWPGIWTIISIKGQDKRMKITSLHYSDSVISLELVQLEGKNETDFSTFKTAYLD